MPLPYNENMSEALGVLAQLPPASQAAGTVTVGPFSAAQAMRVLFLVQIATLSGGSTVDFHVQQSSATGGTYTTIAGTTITQVTAGTNPIVLVEVRAETLAGTGLGPWLKGVLVVGTAAAVVSAVAIAGTMDYAPSSDYGITIAQTLVA